VKILDPTGVLLDLSFFEIDDVCFSYMFLFLHYRSVFEICVLEQLVAPKVEECAVSTSHSRRGQ
jgi:hypothetical protein